MSKTKHIGALEKWFSKFRKYFFSYKDGFYELPYLANSPELIVKSLKSMPFVKHYPHENYSALNTPFVAGDCHYEKIEDGFWLILSNTNVKKNLSFKLYYDKTEEANYNSLTLHVVKTSTKLPKIGQEVENIDRSWALFKSGVVANNYHFKGSESLFLTFYFNDEWKRKNIDEQEISSKKILDDFFESDSDYLYFPNLLEDQQHLYESLIETILDKGENGVKNRLKLKIKSFEVINSFLEKLNSIDIVKREELPEKDIRKLFKAQQFLLENITSKFPSIEVISKKIGMSETKLKKDFKRLFDITLLQYFQQNQIDRAEETLKSKNISIKEVAYAYGYSSVSAFSSTFKKIKGFPPSEI